MPGISASVSKLRSSTKRVTASKPAWNRSACSANTLRTNPMSRPSRTVWMSCNDTPTSRSARMIAASVNWDGEYAR